MSTNNKIVSVVEDELDITNLFHDALRKTIYGVSVVSFNDSVLALKHFKNNKKNYRLVIADWRMPKLNGLELLKKIKKLNPNVRTILISAYEVENESVFQRFMKEGIIDKFIQKPMKLNYLCGEVINQLRASNAE
ncbi:MAG: response regulator [Thaumarchaeota archaeon]|nr:MAG: response regulator [Nitrososphaerota archaeon]TLX91315.1 MAG: response regulator [Nitrososphaerota archaeon]